MRVGQSGKPADAHVGLSFYLLILFFQNKICLPLSSQLLCEFRNLRLMDSASEAASQGNNEKSETEAEIASQIKSDAAKVSQRISEPGK